MTSQGGRPRQSVRQYDIPRQPPQTKRPSIWYPKEYHHLPGFEKILKNIKKFHKNTNLLSYLYQKAKNKVRNLTKGKALQVRNLTKGKALQVRNLTKGKALQVRNLTGLKPTEETS